MVDGSKVEKWMAKRQHALAVVVRDSAQAGDALIARYQDARHGFARLQRVFPIGCGFGGVDGAARAALHGRDAQLLEQRAEFLERVRMEARENQRRFYGRHQRRLLGQVGQSARGHGLRQQLAGHAHFTARRSFVRSFCVHGARLVEIIDLQHQLDGSDAADGVGREDAQPERDGADQLAIDIDRAAAHAAGDVGALRLATQFRQDNVLLRPPGTFPESQDFHWNRLRFRTLKYSPCHALHAGTQVRGFEDCDFPCFGGAVETTLH